MPRKRTSAARRERDRAVVQIEVLWGQNVIAVHQLRSGRSFWVGDGTTARGRREFVLPEGLLKAKRLGLVHVRSHSDIQLSLLDGAKGHVELPEQAQLSLGEAWAQFGCGRRKVGRRIRVPTGAVVVQHLGPITFRVQALVVEKLSSASQWYRSRSLRTIGASACFHVVLALAACASPAPLVDGDGLTQAQRERGYHWVRSAEKRLLEHSLNSEQVLADDDGQEARADNKQGGSGTRAKGEEGSMGNPSAKRSGSRYGVVGPSYSSDPHIARQQALSEAAEFGMVGHLNSGAGGDGDAPTAFWGRDDSFATGSLRLGGARYSRGRTGLNRGTIGHGAGTGSGQGFGSGHGRLGRSSANSAGKKNAPLPPSVGAVTEPLRTVAIDPNGRFATTYRPGRGHLAAFDHAVARGIIPASTRALVSDVGGGYGPALAVPHNKALGFAVDFERAALPPTGGSVHMRIALRSSPRAALRRPQLAVYLTLDTSGSMKGEPMARAKDAARKLVDLLKPTDTFSLVTFSSDAVVKVPAGPVGTRKAWIHSVIQQAEAAGSTNIGEALQFSYSQATKTSAISRAERVVLLLSDGQPTAGETHPRQLSARALSAFQSGVQTSTFGLGEQFDGVLMSTIAADGGGGYYYLSAANQISSALAREIRQRLDPVATAVEIRIRLREDVKLLRVYGSHKLGQDQAVRVRTMEVAADQQAKKRQGIARDRQHDRKGGMRFFIPAFARNDRHSLLLQVALPPGTNARDIGSFELKYKDRLFFRNVGEEAPLRIRYADSDAASAKSMDQSVARTVHGHRAGEDLLAAARYIERRDTSRAIRLLSEREQLLRIAATALGEPALGIDANRLARLRSHVDGSESHRTRPRALALLVETAARSRLR